KKIDNYRYSNEYLTIVTVTKIGVAMKDSTDKGTGDMFGEKRGRGRPKTGNAKTGAERQAAFRAKQQESNVTVTINRELLEGLDAQMQAIRDGGSVLVLTSEQAGEILKAIRKSSLKQLRGQRPRPQGKPTA
ncbi:TPA: hypothetical protein ACNUUU_004108, partial [Aeromonas salmonicida subsp. salmonicida]